MCAVNEYAVYILLSGLFLQDSFFFSDRRQTHDCIKLKAIFVHTHVHLKSTMCLKGLVKSKQLLSFGNMNPTIFSIVLIFNGAHSAKRWLLLLHMWRKKAHNIVLNFVGRCVRCFHI